METQGNLQPKECVCKKLPELTHELNQSLLIMHAYTMGCIMRIKNNCLNSEELQTILKKINEQIGCMTTKIHAIQSF